MLHACITSWGTQWNPDPNIGVMSHWLPSMQLPRLHLKTGVIGTITIRSQLELGTQLVPALRKRSAPSARAISISIASRHVQTSSRPQFPLATPLIHFVPTIMSAGHSAPAIDARALETATDIPIFNSKGEKVRFGDIFANQKTIVVFVRAYSVVNARI